MSINLGTAKGALILEGLADNIKKLQTMTEFLNKASAATRKSSKYNRDHVATLRGVGKESDKQVQALRNISREARKYIQEARTISAANEKIRTSLKHFQQQALIASKVLSSITATASGRGKSGFKAFSQQVDRTAADMAKLAQKTAAAEARIRSLRSSMATNLGSGFRSFSAVASDTTQQASNRAAGLTGASMPIAWGSRPQQATPGIIGNARTALNQVGVLKRLQSVGMETAKSISTVSGAFSNLSKNMVTNAQKASSWWSRFGGVAAGFWIAYRSINALEFAISQLSRTFASGLSVLDDYQEGVAGVAGMIALTYEGGAGFVDRFTRVSTVMRGTMEEMIRLAPKYRLSTEEISAGLRELAQFGVIVQRNNAEATASTFAMIREISMSTGSTVKQIRQEIQALFTGTARVTDQFSRMLKITMPDLYSQLLSKTLSVQQKWELLTSSVKDYSIAVEEANKTVSGQATIIQNSLKIISAKALEASGIYKIWVTTLKDFADGLFDTEGHLTELGKSIYDRFYRVWEVIHGIVQTIVDLYNGIVDVFNLVTSKLTPEINNAALTFLKWAFALSLAKNALSAIILLARTLLRLSGLTLLLDLFKAVRTLPFAALFKVVRVVGMLGTALYLGVKAGQGLLSIFYVLAEIGKSILGNLSEQLEAMGHNLKVVKDKIVALWNRTEYTGPGFKDVPESWQEGEFLAAIDRGVAKAENIWKLGTDEIKDQVVSLFKETSNAAMDSISNLLTDVSNSDVAASVDDFMVKYFGAIRDNFTFGPIKPPIMLEHQGDVGDLVAKNTLTDKATKDTADKFKAMYEYIGDSTKDFFSRVFHGEITSATQAFEEFALSIAKAFQDAMTDIVSEYFKAMIKMQFSSTQQSGGGFFSSIISGITGLFTGGGGIEPGTGHRANYAGGVINEPVFGFGLSSGRTYSFAEKGPERVLSNKDSFSSPSVNVAVNVINQSGQQVDAKQGQLKFDGERYIIDVILNRMATDPNFRSSLGV